MLRVVFLLLIVLNGAFFAWVKGWFGPMAPSPADADREPHRVQAQVNPERVTLVPPAAASPRVAARRAASLEAPVCLEAGPFAPLDVAAAEAAMGRANLPAGSWTRATHGGPIWLVFGGRFPEPAARSARAAEFKRLDVEYELIQAPPELAPGFVLSRHASRSAAETALAGQLTRSAAVLRELRLVAMPSVPGSIWIRAAQVDPGLRSQLNALGAVNPALGGGFRPCAADDGVR